MTRRRRFKLSTTHIIMLSFLGAILGGSLLLCLPISSADGNSIGYIDALFTATTSTCVTGLVTLPTVTTFSIFGQAVILVLIQIGGLGIITVMSGLMIMLNRKMGLGERLLLQDAFNLNSMAGLSSFIKRVLLGTFVIEGVGAMLYMPVFVGEFGPRGIWVSVFNSVSAFCNAGIDIIGETSLYDYQTNPLVNITTCLLIILGGIGYIVWWDVIRVFSLKKRRLGLIFKRLTLQSKIAISFTLALILIGGLMFFIFEGNNPDTIGNLSLPEKIQASLFQSVTTRTAGFASIPQENLKDSSAIITMLLMFIGGSPVGTAGGIKTVTLAVLIASAKACVQNKTDVTLFDRNVSKMAVGKSAAVCTMSFAIVFVSTVLLSAVTEADFLDVIFETVSATGTVGLTRGLTTSLNLWSKIIVILTMYFGRVGPISLALALNVGKHEQNQIKNPTEDISVG